MKNISIREMAAGDWEVVSGIYAEGIATGQATFETEVPAWEGWNSSHLDCARLIAQDHNGIVVGWAALSAVSKRRAYAGVAEVSVYVAESHRGQGIGQTLLESLVRESETHGIWTLQAVVFPENLATVALHKRCGFREVGRRERISKLNGAWRDTILLERRSMKAGTD